MPADSDPFPRSHRSARPSPPPPVALPYVFRPRGVRIAAWVFSVLLIGTCVVMWFAFPDRVREQFALLERVTTLLFGVAFCVAGYALGRSRVEADDDGVTVVNGLRSHRLAWAQIIAVTLRPGSPWALLDLSDGSTVAAMGIQGSDGDRAVLALRQLRALVAKKTTPPGPH